MADPVVRYEADEKVSVITLNRPEKLVCRAGTPSQILEKARSQWRAWSRVPVPERAVNCAVAV